jgi:triacylglycerol lipase
MDRPADRAAAPTVVLLHGLGRTALSMRPLARALAAGGYRVRNLGYPSRRASVAALARRVAGGLEPLAPGEPLHFVTHSLGGIVLRVMVAEGLLPLARVRRAVMLAPPSLGSELPDALGRHRLVGPVYRVTMGPAGGELGCGPDAVPARLPPVPFELGVIAGSRSLNPLLGRLIAGPSDGKVSVARARAPGMRDFLVVPHTHTFVMRSPEVARQVLHFLAHGRFATVAPTAADRSRPPDAPRSAAVAPRPEEP